MDMLVNTLICTPFYSVSTYSPSQVNVILKITDGFPVQQKNVDEVAAAYVDERGNAWNNPNVFSKQVSSQASYRGPLYLEGSAANTSDTNNLHRPLAFLLSGNGSVAVTKQEPGFVRININATVNDTVVLMQNYYPGWKVFYNGKELSIVKQRGGGMAVAVSTGEGILEFHYERRCVWIPALFLHLVVLSFFIWKIIRFFKVNRIRSSSPS